MIKTILLSIFFYGILLLLLDAAGVSFWYCAIIYGWVVVIDFTSYVMGIRKGLDL